MPHVLDNGWDQWYLIQTIRKMKTIKLEKEIIKGNKVIDRLNYKYKKCKVRKQVYLCF